MSRDPELMVVPRRRWQWWRDLAVGLLALTVLLLVLQLRGQADDMLALREQITTNAITATAQRAEQAARIDALTVQSESLARNLTDAQAENRRLTDLVVELGGDPAPPPVSNGNGDDDLGTAAPSPAPSPSPAPEPTPEVRPTRTTSPSPSPTVRPSPAPSCTVAVLGLCLVPGA